MLRGLLIFAGIATVWAQTDARQIVVRSVQADDQSAKLARYYTFQVHHLHQDLDGKGNVRSSETRTTEVLFIGGKEYRRLVQKNDKPLPPDEERKETRKLDKAVADASRLSQAQLDQRYAEYEKNQAKERERLRYIPDAFDFKLLREESIAGRPAYVISAEPRPGYHGKYQELLTKIHGTLWVNKDDYQWVKFDAETLNTISIGLFLARLAKGTHLEFEQTRVNDEIWLPKRAAFTGSARLAVLKKFNVAEEVTFGNYRKFQTDSRVVSSAEISQHQ